MRLIMPCEKISNYILPTLRACIARELYNKHKLSQMKIASILGVSQPAINKYLSDDYDKRINEILKDKELKRSIIEISSTIIKNNLNDEETTKLILELCRKLIKNDLKN